MFTGCTGFPTGTTKSHQGCSLPTGGQKISPAMFAMYVERQNFDQSPFFSPFAKGDFLNRPYYLRVLHGAEVSCPFRAAKKQNAPAMFANYVERQNI